MTSSRSLVAIAACCVFSFILPSGAVAGGDVGLAEVAKPVAPWWRLFTGAVQISADSIERNGISLSNFEARLQVSSAGLRVEAARADVAGGEVHAKYWLRPDAVVEALAVSGTGLQTASLGALGQTVTSTLEFHIEGRTRGRHLADLMPSFNGVASFGLGPGELSGTSIERIDSDILSVLMMGLNPFTKKESSAELTCAKADLEFRDGIVSAPALFGIQTENIIVSCGGVADFAAANVDLRCRPMKLRSTPLKLPGLVEAINIKGDLAQPNVEVDAAGVIEQGIQLGQGIVSFRLPSAPSFLGRSAMPEDCELIAEGRGAVEP